MHRELGARLRWYIGLGEPPIDRRLRDLPYEIGDEEDDHAGESASSRVRSVSRSVIPTRSICRFQASHSAASTIRRARDRAPG